MITGMDVDVVIATLSDIKRAIETLYALRSSIDEALVEVVEERGSSTYRRGKRPSP